MAVDDWPKSSQGPFTIKSWWIFLSSIDRSRTSSYSNSIISTIPNKNVQRSEVSNGFHLQHDFSSIYIRSNIQRQGHKSSETHGCPSGRRRSSCCRGRSREASNSWTQKGKPGQDPKEGILLVQWYRIGSGC